MTKIRFEPCTRVKATWLAANARDADKRELKAASDGNLRTAGIVCNDGSPEDLRWVARADGKLIAAFGIAWNPVINPSVGFLWLYGTEQLPKAIPAISRFFVENTLKMADDYGLRRLEIRTIEDHDIAHRWLERLGANRVAELPDYGTEGETFVLYAWTRKEWAELMADPARQSPWLRRALKRGMIPPTQEKAA